MPRKDFSEMPCSVARTLEVIGDRWTILILRDAFYGVRRFDDLRRGLGVARNILTDRLNKLIEHGVLERRPYQDRPPRFEYRLTDKGRDLLPVLLTLTRWGDRWETDESGPPVTFTHTKCGHETVPTLACSECGEELLLRELRVRSAPAPYLVSKPVVAREDPRAVARTPDPV
jgi:DNA-binding HxlR family transcriptional regulator